VSSAVADLLRRGLSPQAGCTCSEPHASVE
jgi:hypothetical protein